MHFRNKLFYYLKPFIPRKLQLYVRRKIVQSNRKKHSHIWPIDPGAGTPPPDWKGWPENKKFALVISHDVDTQKGHDTVRKLMEIEESYGFRSAINIVPEKYQVSGSLLEEIKARGFELCIHGLNHDGKLFLSKEIFVERAKKINQYIKEWGITGFTSPSMHHNLDWMHLLDIEHSTSTFDTDPFEPQPDGAGTIFPFLIGPPESGKACLEMPYTLPQDSTLFIIMQETGIDIWKKKLDWIAEKGGMALFNSHPDYMNFADSNCGSEEYPVRYYMEFLEYVKETYKGQYWAALPIDVAKFWKSK